MRITFYGAAGEVTGSCYLVETDRARLLVDFGMHQGGGGAERKNRRFPPMDAANLDAVVLTHAHLDHCGRLPLLPRHGYRGPIYATGGTIDLTGLVLRDAAHIQETDAERAMRRRQGRGAGRRRPPIKPLYTTADAETVLKQLEPLIYQQPRQIAPGITVRLVDAGHILGSASIEMTVTEGGEGGKTKTVVFSGDIGVKDAPLLRDPTTFSHADLVIMESTYGDRDHKTTGATIDELAALLGEARLQGGSVLIPAFAVGRTQTLIYYMGILEREERLRSTDVFIDSPMAITATELYRRHRDSFDDDTWAIIDSGDTPLNFSGLHLTRTADESRALNGRFDGLTIIAASGMCTGGRIMHHLRHRLDRPDTHLLFVGYQAEGTLGRRIVEGDKSVKVMGEPMLVRAKVHTLGGFSAHAGRSGLIQWAGAMASARPRPPRIVLTHGEDPARRSLAGALQERFRFQVEQPGWGSSVEL